MNNVYVWEKLHGAVYCLIGTSTMKVRLVEAFGTLSFIPEDQIPEEIRQQFRDIMQLIRTAKSEGVEGRIKAAVRQMNESECYDIAKIILSMYDTITRSMKPKY